MLRLNHRIYHYDPQIIPEQKVKNLLTEMSDFADRLLSFPLQSVHDLVSEFIMYVLAVTCLTQSLSGSLPDLSVKVMPHQVTQLVHQILAG